MIVEDVMTALPYAVSTRDTVGRAMRMLSEADIRHLPVVDEDTLVGIVSDRDLRELTPTAFDELERPDDVRRRLARPIGDVMNTNLYTVHPEAELREAIDLMIEYKIGAVPVVELGSRKLVGIVSYVDALRAARDLV